MGRTFQTRLGSRDATDDGEMRRGGQPDVRRLDAVPHEIELHQAGDIRVVVFKLASTPLAASFPGLISPAAKLALG